MRIDKMLKESHIKYKFKRINNITIYNIEDEKMLIVIENNNNVFSISRKIFNEIDEELLPYSFCLIDSSKKQLYFIDIKEPNNSLRNSFDHTNKDFIYFGKEVLNNKINEDELISKIDKIGK